MEEVEDVVEMEQGRIHSTAIADGWAGVVRHSQFNNSTDGPTDQTTDLMKLLMDQLTDGLTD